MSTLKVNALNNGGSAIDLPNSFKLRGNPIEQGYTSSATEPTSPNTGDIWWDSANEKLYQYLNGEFKELTLAPSGVPWGGDRAVVRVLSSTNNMQYFSVSTSGNATTFGTSIVADSGGTNPASTSDSSRGLFAGGNYPPNFYPANLIEYITISTTGNGTDFGDLTSYRREFQAVGDGTYGIFAGGNGNSNIIDYVTVQTTGNATDFGDLTVGRPNKGGTGVQDSTRGVFHAGGPNTGSLFVMDYITMATTGNATDFGDPSVNTYAMSGCSDSTRGVWCGSITVESNYNTLEYITIQTTGNATDFGDALANTYIGGGASDGTYGVFASAASVNISHITIQTTGNASDHGDLSFNSAGAMCAGAAA